MLRLPRLTARSSATQVATRGKIRRIGYDIHITRTEEWSDNGASQIARAEWLAVAEADPELTPDPENGKAFYTCGDSWFDWFEGNVDTKNPDHAVLAKALELAGVLDARVQGDDGELYESPDEYFRPRRR